MGLPAIATNWSGNTEFMLDDNSYLIPIDGLEPVPNGAFQVRLFMGYLFPLMTLRFAFFWGVLIPIDDLEARLSVEY